MLLALKAPPGDRPGGFDPDLQAVSQVNARLAGQFLALEMRASKILLAETVLRQQQLGMVLSTFARPYFIDPRNAVAMQEISRRWMELVVLTQSAFFRAFFSFPASSHIHGLKNRSKLERRVSARIIPFPDRRAVQ